MALRRTHKASEFIRAMRRRGRLSYSRNPEEKREITIKALIKARAQRILNRKDTMPIKLDTEPGSTLPLWRVVGEWTIAAHDAHEAEAKIEHAVASHTDADLEDCSACPVDDFDIPTDAEVDALLDSAGLPHSAD